MCQVLLEKKDNMIIATLSGELVLGCTSEIKEKVKAYAESNKLYRLLIDMTEVTFIDSSGHKEPSMENSTCPLTT